MMEIDVTKGKTEPRDRGNLNPPEFNSIDEEKAWFSSINTRKPE